MDREELKEMLIGQEEGAAKNMYNPELVKIILDSHPSMEHKMQILGNFQYNINAVEPILEEREYNEKSLEPMQQMINQLNEIQEQLSEHLTENPGKPAAMVMHINTNHIIGVVVDPENQKLQILDSNWLVHSSGDSLAPSEEYKKKFEVLKDSLNATEGLDGPLELEIKEDIWVQEDPTSCGRCTVQNLLDYPDNERYYLNSEHDLIKTMEERDLDLLEYYYNTVTPLEDNMRHLSEEEVTRLLDRQEEILRTVREKGDLINHSKEDLTEPSEGMQELLEGLKKPFDPELYQEQEEYSERSNEANNKSFNDFVKKITQDDLKISKEDSDTYREAFNVFVDMMEEMFINHNPEPLPPDFSDKVELIKEALEGNVRNTSENDKSINSNFFDFLDEVAINLHQQSIGSASRADARESQQYEASLPVSSPPSPSLNKGHRSQGRGV